MKAYAPRPIAPLPRVMQGDWTLKRYSITYGGDPFETSRFTAGLALALQELPTPAVAPGRLGIGFLIEHQGSGIDYVVLGWWDRDNELPLRVFVREHNASAVWRAARGSESVCVWDLQVIFAERQAYVTTVLSRNKKSRDEYLRCDIRDFLQDIS